MPKGPIRRAQLIAPFGVGAMVVVRDGTSLIAGGLDHWFKPESGGTGRHQIDAEEFKVEEWRLQRLLGVDHLRLPPDYRRPGQNTFNCNLTVPFLRFPQWHFCPGCFRLDRKPLTVREKVKCRECERKHKLKYLIQVPFVAMCEHGHLQDFPWREWAHKSANPSCDKTMYLIATGGATLAAQKVKCDCGVERTLARIMEANPDGNTTLSISLDSSGQLFLCQGRRPWLGTEDNEPCTCPIRGSLRSASNVYFADVRSAIYLPRGDESTPSELITLFEKFPLSIQIKLLSDAGAVIKAEYLRRLYNLQLQPYSDKQIESAVQIVTSKRAEGTEGAGQELEEQQVSFRRAEYEALRKSRNEEALLINAADLSRYKEDIPRYFAKIMLVKKLRETRALAGFNRIFPQNDLTLEQRKSLLSRKPRHGHNAWLPAYIVYGEGIFLEFNEDRLREWEGKSNVIERVHLLAERYRKIQESRRLRERPMVPRFVLLHTFAHLLINQLTFECGYSSAALRERLYVSDEQNSLMAGILIYTAAGDAEGTLGGLVGMGRHGCFESVVRKALDKGRWCSADPVCMELGAHGQGPDSCNLAACHNCSLVPETACEEFNRFLDRALIVGSLDEPHIGYFSSGD